MEEEIYIIPDFFTEDQYKELKFRMENVYKYISTYQPSDYPLSERHLHGDRLKHFPCWETTNLENIDTEFNSIIEEKQKELLGTCWWGLLRMRKFDFKSFIRKTLTEEIKASSFNNKYSQIHTDKSDFASVLYFEDAPNNGLAIFDNGSDVPSVSIGAEPNRLILYKGSRPHSACFDSNFEVRYALCSFITINKEEIN